MWCSECGSDKHLVGNCPRRFEKEKKDIASAVEEVSRHVRPKEEVMLEVLALPTECSVECPYRADALKWRNQQERKKVQMSEYRKRKREGL